MVVEGCCILEVVYFAEGRLFSGDVFGDGGFFVVEFELGVGTVLVDQVEGVAVAARGDGVAVRGGGDSEFVEDSLVFEDLAQFALHAFAEDNGVEWFFGIANVPDFKGEEVT